jgi:anthranilate phosphoribosyltransferase
MINSLNIIQNKLLQKKDLNFDEASYLIKNILNKTVDEVLLSSLLTLLYTKGETYDEIKAFVFYLKSKSNSFKINDQLMDTCGTGGDNKNSFNFSTATCIVLSSFDIKIAKHGNRSITSKSGSFDVLEALGIKLSSKINNVKSYYKKKGICFLFAPYFHPILINVSNVRKSLFFRTIFNLLGPLLNPVNLSYQLLGVSDEKNLNSHAKCLKDLKIKRGWVVHNMNGYDELTTTSKNKVLEIYNNNISRIKIIEPKDLGFKRDKEIDLKGGTAKENAFLMENAFKGETGPIRDNIVLNSAAGLVISEKAKNIKEAINMVNYNIDNGVVMKKLKSLVG